MSAFHPNQTLALRPSGQCGLTLRHMQVLAIEVPRFGELAPISHLDRRGVVRSINPSFIEIFVGSIYMHGCHARRVGELLLRHGQSVIGLLAQPVWPKSTDAIERQCSLRIVSFNTAT
jgi:hypothetical protein